MPEAGSQSGSSSGQEFFVSHSKTQLPSRLRILKIGNRKRAFSLEPIFWEALESIARAQGQKLGALVEELLASGPHRNASSALRTAATDWLLAERRKFLARDFRKIGQRIVDSIPVPAFLLNQHKEILAFNRAFLETGSDHHAQKPLIAQLRLNVSFPRVVDLLTEKPEKPIALKGILDFGDFQRAATVTVAFLETVGKNAFFLCTLQAQPEAAAAPDETGSGRLGLGETP